MAKQKYTTLFAMLDQARHAGQNEKMKSFPATVALCLLFGVVSAEARLGETLAQCIERYGPIEEKKPASVKESDPEACVFSKSGITALVEFKGGIAWRLVFRMIGMTAQETETLLKANMADGGWGPALKINGQDCRLSTDRRRIAILTPAADKADVPSLEIVSRDFAAASYATYSSKMAEIVGKAKGRGSDQNLKGF